MTESTANNINVYLEIGQKRVFACALDWPGWCGHGRKEEAARQNLLDYGPRYAQVLQPAPIPFQPPATTSAFVVTERLEGNATTDFGAPDITAASDSRPVDQAEWQRFQALLPAYWQAFDAAVQQASGKTLRKGPRGGGRDLDQIVAHVLGADASYIRRLGGTFKPDEAAPHSKELARMRQVILDTLAAAVSGGLPERGPRGGKIWKPRYFVRRVGWHVLDHTWEIENRLVD